VRILLVEDHDDTREIVAKLLGRIGYEVKAAAGMQTALDMMRREKVDVILSDIGLPDGNGYDLVRAAKSMQPEIKAVALTALAAKEDFLLSREAGFDFHLTKPVDFHELRNVLRGAAAAEQA
jgi:CheY-like chemotaxis protein